MFTIPLSQGIRLSPHTGIYRVVRHSKILGVIIQKDNLCTEIWLFRNLFGSPVACGLKKFTKICLSIKGVFLKL
jgi:hypothetical protein